MKVKMKVTHEFDVQILSVVAGVRYWEDSTVNGVEDTEGKLIPCRIGENWCPEIDIETGKIVNWNKGTTAALHYKVCDDGTYILRDLKLKEVAKKEGYVPDCMCPKEAGHGDYIIMDIDENGMIQDWEFDPECITGEDE